MDMWDMFLLGGLLLGGGLILLGIALLIASRWLPDKDENK